MSDQPYEIDELMSRLRSAWAQLNVSPQTYASALKEAGRTPIHHNTLRRLDEPNWSPSRGILRDLEEHLIRQPLCTVDLPKRIHRRRRRATSAPTV